MIASEKIAWIQQKGYVLGRIKSASRSHQDTCRQGEGPALIL